MKDKFVEIFRNFNVARIKLAFMLGQANLEHMHKMYDNDFKNAIDKDDQDTDAHHTEALIRKLLELHGDHAKLYLLSFYTKDFEIKGMDRDDIKYVLHRTIALFEEHELDPVGREITLLGLQDENEEIADAASWYFGNIYCNKPAKQEDIELLENRLSTLKNPWNIQCFTQLINDLKKTQS
jgi:hypothetical protein